MMPLGGAGTHQEYVWNMCGIFMAYLWYIYDIFMVSE
jgi:hypothetical protein